MSDNAKASPSAASDKSERPTASEVLSAVVGAANAGKVASESSAETFFRQDFQKRAIESQYAYAHLKGIRDHYGHKGKWSWFLMGAIGVMVVFQSLIIILVGLGKFDFTKYEWLLQMLLVQNLAQVVGLAVYAVKYLFSDISNQRIGQ